MVRWRNRCAAQRSSPTLQHVWRGPGYTSVGQAELGETRGFSMGRFCASRDSGVNSGAGAAASRRVGVDGDRLRNGHAADRTRRWSVLNYWASPYTSPCGINRRQIGIWTALMKLDFGERSSMGVDGDGDLLWCGCGPGVGTVDRVGVASACKTLPSTDYEGSGWPEIVVEIRGPTTSRLLQPRGRGSPGATVPRLDPAAG